MAIPANEFAVASDLNAAAIALNQDFMVMVMAMRNRKNVKN